MQFLRLGRELLHRGHAVNLVDYADGCMSGQIGQEDFRLIEYSDEGEVAIPRDSTAVFQTMTPWSIFPALNIDADTRLLFWTCHPLNLVPAVPFLSAFAFRGRRLGRFFYRFGLTGYWKKARKFLRTALEHEAIVFMDKGNLNTTAAFLDVDVPNARLLPIPVEVPETTTQRKRAAGDPIRFGWVGRIADFKYPILLRAMKDLGQVALALDADISIAVAGDGPFLSRLQSESGKVVGLPVRFLGQLNPQAVDEFLDKDIDILLAMGTTAIEGGVRGIPTVLLDFSYNEVQEHYTYRWLHEQSGYSLGTLIGPQHYGQPNSLHRIVQSALSEYQGLSEVVRNYVIDRHAVRQVCDLFLDVVERSTLTWGDLEGAGVLEGGILYGLRKSGRDLREMDRKNVESTFGVFG